MHDAITSATILLEPPVRSEHAGVGPVECTPSGVGTDDAPVRGGGTGLGFLLRAPGLILMATVFLVEGYSWLGVLDTGHSSAASILSGTAGRGAVALLAPLAALVLSPGGRGSGWFVEDLVVVAAVAATVATGTALVVGGPAVRYVAGGMDLLLAATALGAVLLGERARRRSDGTVSDRTAAAV